MKEIDETNFPEFIQHPLAVLIFSSPWCTSCKKVSSALEGLSRRLESQVAFGTCDISTSPSVASSVQVFSVPTVIIFKHGKELKRMQGPCTEAAMAEALEESL